MDGTSFCRSYQWVINFQPVERGRERGEGETHKQDFKGIQWERWTHLVDTKENLTNSGWLNFNVILHIICDFIILSSNFTKFALYRDGTLN